MSYDYDDYRSDPTYEEAKIEKLERQVERLQMALEDAKQESAELMRWWTERINE